MKHKSFQQLSVGAAVAAILGSAAAYSPAALSADDDTLAEVTVTGSRIVRRDLDSSSPIVTVGGETFEQTGTQSVEATLNQLPQFVPSQTMFSSGDVQPSAFSNPGIVSLNLRGLGPNRNLVLVDGRRAQPANAQLVVDINSIPTAAVESVEIISGGASATYGADAMGGVTNFNMKKNFQGLSLDAQTMLTEQGGGPETSASALIGGNFADDRGNAMLGITYTHRDALMAADRQFYVDGWRDVNTPGGEGIPFSQIGFPAVGFTPNAPSTAAFASIFGAGRNYGGESVYVNPDGTLFLNTVANPGIGYTGPVNDQFKILGSGTTSPGSVSANNLNTIVTTPLERYSVFGNAHFDVNDHVTAFMQMNMSSMTVDTLLNYAPGDLAVERNHPGRLQPSGPRGTGDIAGLPPQPDRALLAVAHAGFCRPAHHAQFHRHVPGAGRRQGRSLQYELELRSLLLAWQDLADHRNERLSGAAELPDRGAGAELRQEPERVFRSAAVLRAEVHQRPADLHVLRPVAGLQEFHRREHEAPDGDEAGYRRGQLHR